MHKSTQQDKAHFSLIRSFMFGLPLSTARVLYKCVLATFVVYAKKAQRSATNVGADIDSADNMSSNEYLNAIGTIGDQWNRANKKSRKAFHNLRCLDEALILGKMRASVPKYATGGFDHAIDSVDTGEGHTGEDLGYDSAAENAGMELLPKPQPKQETEGVPTEPMAPVEVSTPSTPVEVMNYCGNF